MKTKCLLLGIVALLAVGWWVGRAVWRAHRQLVSLDVRNATLAEVLRKIERRTWKKIRAEKSVANARVTLHVTDKPLNDVLDRLAEQAGARWSTLYAVYDSSRALKALDSALRGDGKIEPAGWMKTAPKPPESGQPVANGTDSDFPPVPTPGPPRPMPGGGIGGATGPGPMPGRGGMRMVRRGPGGPIVFQGDPNGPMEIWSPEELLMESLLRPRLGDDRATQDSAATPRAAAETARKVHGRWTTYLAFRKSSMGVGFGVTTPARPGLSSQPFSGHGPVPNSNERFDRLTPQQRVQRARERRGFPEP
ncbi:MAG: hypothetical protein HY735_00330 [Verrucomicrobia bacterium]|nr:hypothetical protein [Verrucomicrobiota bacterium]